MGAQGWERAGDCATCGRSFFKASPEREGSLLWYPCQCREKKLQDGRKKAIKKAVASKK